MPKKAGAPATQPARQGHSKTGIVSFIIALCVIVISFILVVFSALIQVKNPSYFDGNSAGAVLLGLMVIFAAFAGLCGSVLGIVGLFEKNKNIIFSILGAVFNAFVVLGWIMLMIMGSVA